MSTIFKTLYNYINPSYIRKQKSRGNENVDFCPYKKFKSNSGHSRLNINNLNLHIGDNHILKGVDLSIPTRKITCIIGPSGCGKSTLLKTLNRLNDTVEDIHISGSVSLGKSNIIESNGAELIELRRKIGLVSQSPSPLPMSVFDNIAYGCRIHGLKKRDHLEQVVEHYLTEAGLWDEIKDRLHTPAVRLSIGQQQRLCLARSLAVEPEFILADESTSALDPVSSKIIEDLFVKLKQYYSIVMVTHTLRQALRIADYIVFMYMGEIIEVGDAKEVLHNPQKELTKNYLSGVFS